LRIQNASSKMLRKLIPQNKPREPPRKNNLPFLFFKFFNITVQGSQTIERNRQNDIFPY
jgi:hypothetical protein